MQSILAKAWVLLGWFYFSLIGLVGLFYVSPPKLKEIIATFVIAAGAVLAIFISANKLFDNQAKIAAFFRPVDEKVDSASFGQASFAVELKKVLPQGAKICIVPRLQSLYLAYKLYPHVPIVLGKAADYSNCEFVVSQFGEILEPVGHKILEYKGSYLYQLR